MFLDGDELTLVGLSLDGEKLGANSYAATPSSLTIHEPPQKPFDLTIETALDPSANTKLMGLYRSSGTYCTQCEAEGFRRITYFLDRPDVLAVYRTRIEAERGDAPVLLSNGNLIETGLIPGTSRHYAIWHDPFPKPSYLFALVGGKLSSVEDRFVTASGRAVKLAIYVEPGREDRCGYALDSLKRAMRWDERAFGREYDLDVFNIVAVSDFNMGAMENKGLNVFNDKYVLASPETATDGDYAGIEAVIAHEYFHNWTGNRITCRDWFQLCLKEGLTVFRDQEFSSDERSRPVKRIGDVRGLKSAQFTEDAGPLAHPVRPETYHEINNFYTATVYQKGAEVVRMLKTLLGERGFRAGMDLYFTRCDGKAATVEDFLGCFAGCERHRSYAVQALVFASRNAGARAQGKLRCGALALSPGSAADGAADAGAKRETTDAHSARFWIARPGRSRSAACPGEGKQDQRGRIADFGGGGNFRFRWNPRAAHSLVQPRIFGADQTRFESRRGRPCFHRRPRQRCVQPLRCRIHARDAPSRREHGGNSRGAKSAHSRCVDFGAGAEPRR